MNNSQILIESHHVHLWRTSLNHLISKEEAFLKVLNPEELDRANRFVFPQHRQRFAIARGVLRTILGLYTGGSPADIQFTYGRRGKPFLLNNDSEIQFNLSHSEDFAVYALTKQKEIGVDIQKIEKKFQEGIAKRFFSEREYTAIMELSEPERPKAFYRLWACKEALIKAAGEGLYVPLGNFAVSLQEESQWILLSHEGNSVNYFLEYFTANAEFCSAYATAQEVDEIHYWEWTDLGPVSLPHF